MSEKVEVFLFNKHIADLYKEHDRIIMKQHDNAAHICSPLSIPDSEETYDCTPLVHLERVPGFVSDSLPGSFGNEILRKYFEAENDGTPPTVIDKLLFIGDRGMGALSYKPQKNPSENQENTLSLSDMFQGAKELKKDVGFTTLHDALLVAAHSFAGGARSKAVASLDLDNNKVHIGHRNHVPEGYIPAMIKYDDSMEGGKDKSVYSRLEYIYYLLATKAGINMSKCHLLSAEGREHFVTERFDLIEGKRKHVHSLAGLLQLDYNVSMSTSYEELLITGRKLGVHHDSITQLFNQMLFNYMFVNQDDHSRNFSFMCDESFQWRCTPAYDLTYAQGQKQTIEHQLTLYGKPLSKIDVYDIANLAKEFDIQSAQQTIAQMFELREEMLPKLLTEYDINKERAGRIIKAVSARNFEGGQ